MLSVVVGGEASELFFVFAYSVGDGFDGGAQGGDLVGEPGEGAAGGGAVAVLVAPLPRPAYVGGDRTGPLQTDRFLTFDERVDRRV